MPPASSPSISTNIPQRMDRLPWSRWHWLVVTALGITWVLDGLEVSLVAALGPVLTHTTTLHLKESEVGLAASASTSCRSRSGTFLGHSSLAGTSIRSDGSR
jgi:hypothetical protein